MAYHGEDPIRAPIIWSVGLRTQNWGGPLVASRNSVPRVTPMLHATIATRHCITGHIYYGIDFFKCSSYHSLIPILSPTSRPLRQHRTSVEYINIHETRSYGLFYFLNSDSILCNIMCICNRRFAYWTLAFWFWLAGYAARIGVQVTSDISCYIWMSTYALGRDWRDVISVVGSKALLDIYCVITRRWMQTLIASERIRSCWLMPLLFLGSDFPSLAFVWCV